MNRTAGLVIATGLFCASAVTGWLVSASAPAARRGRIPASAEQGRAGAVTPELLLSKFERQLTGGGNAAGGPWSSDAFERLFRNNESWRDIREYAEGWVTHDPGSVFAWLQGGGRDNEKVCVLFEAWTKADLESALTAAARLSSPEIRGQALFSALQVLWRTDPARARALFNQYAGLLSEKKEYRLPPARGETAVKDLEFLKSLPHGPARGNLLVEVLRNCIPFDDHSPAIPFWNAAPESLKRELLAAGFLDCGGPSIFSAVRVTSFPEAEDLLRTRAESTRDVRDAAYFLDKCATAWAARDLPAALKWTLEHVPGTEGANRAAFLFGWAAASNFDLALRTWQSLPDGMLKGRAAKSLLTGVPEGRKTEARVILGSLNARGQSLKH